MRHWDRVMIFVEEQTECFCDGELKCVYEDVVNAGLQGGHQDGHHVQEVQHHPGKLHCSWNFFSFDILSFHFDLNQNIMT